MCFLPATARLDCFGNWDRFFLPSICANNVVECEISWWHSIEILMDFPSVARMSYLTRHPEVFNCATSRFFLCGSSRKHFFSACGKCYVAEIDSSMLLWAAGATCCHFKSLIHRKLTPYELALADRDTHTAPLKIFLLCTPPKMRHLSWGGGALDVNTFDLKLFPGSSRAIVHNAEKWSKLVAPSWTEIIRKSWMGIQRTH